MEFELKTEMPEDFQHLCEIFQINPVDVVKEILNKISFPYFYSNLNETGKWPTYLFLEFLDKAGEINEKEMEFNEPFLEKVNNAVTANIKTGVESDSNKLKAQKAIRSVMREWHKALSKERARYLLDNLPGEEEG